MLSGGERARLSIAKMISCGVSLLILDEPTNHLDIASKETLEEALRNYDGTVLCVSHDRYFIRALATDVLEIDKAGYAKGYTLFHGDYDAFLEKREKLTEVQTTVKQETAGKLSFEEAKRQKNRRRAAENRYAAVEKEIGRVESLIAEKLKEQESDKAASDYALLNKLYAETQQLEEHLAALYEEYESLDEELNS